MRIRRSKLTIRENLEVRGTAHRWQFRKLANRRMESYLPIGGSRHGKRCQFTRAGTPHCLFDPLTVARNSTLHPAFGRSEIFGGVPMVAKCISGDAWSTIFHRIYMSLQATEGRRAKWL